MKKHLKKHLSFTKIKLCVLNAIKQFKVKLYSQYLNIFNFLKEKYLLPKCNEVQKILIKHIFNLNEIYSHVTLYKTQITFELGVLKTK